MRIITLSEYKTVKFFIFAEIGVEGEVLIIHNATRYCDDVYECVADNKVEQPATHQVKVNVQCECLCVCVCVFVCVCVCVFVCVCVCKCE